MKKMTRKEFLGTASCAALGSTTLLSTLGNLFLANKAISSNMAPPTDYKALVCVLLAGGNDSFNMLVPRGTTEYNEYAASRSNLALLQNSLLAINLLVSDGKLYGVNPAMTKVKNMFEAERLAFVANIGTLIEPVANGTEFYSGLKKLPLGIYSHSDQIEQWQTSVPQSRQALGWAGKMADMLQSTDTNLNNGISMNISLSGRNVWQAGQLTYEYSIGNDASGVSGLESVNTWANNAGFLDEARLEAIDNMNSMAYSNILQKTLSNLSKSSFDAVDTFKNAMSTVSPFATPFSNTSLSKSLNQIAKVIAARESLGKNRQTFFVTIGGFDNHDELIENQAYLLATVSNAIGEFFEALDEINIADSVTLFTVSDFARTLTTNGNGSDHAWGGNSIVAGGAVNGKKIYGSYPSLQITGNPLMVSNRGNLIPTTSADAYFAELALWFGVSPFDLATILPNIGNFYTPGSSNPPLGFMNM
jgi:uncharacterized protein (DUF1501 family)